MSKININLHASMVIIESEKTNEFLLDKYDETYRIKDFRGRANLVGGSYSNPDKSPRNLLLRELYEEFSIPLGRDSDFASFKDVALIKDTIITNARPYKDYVVKIKSSIKAIFSIFIATMPQPIFEIARENILNKKLIKNEGSSVICKLEDFVSKKILTAWATSLIIGDYKDALIPNPEGIKIRLIGKPRKSFRDYFSEFRYVKKFNSNEVLFSD